MRYSRHQIFIGNKNQEKIRNATVGIIGVGAIGSNSAELLVGAGIGRLIIIDRDVVEESNLVSQRLYRKVDIGKPKAIQAKEILEEINSDVDVDAFSDNLNFKNIEILSKCDLILDGTDNFETRFLVNEFCAKNKIPLVYAGVIKDRGMIMNITPGKACLRCVFKDYKNPETCETVGVLNTIVSVISSLQVNEAFKILIGEKVENSLIYFNIWNKTLETIKVNKNKNCNVCNRNFEYIYGKRLSSFIKLCGSGRYQISKENIDLAKLKPRLEKIDKIKDFGDCLSFKNMTIFKNRVLIKAESEREANNLYTKYIES